MIKWWQVLILIGIFWLAYLGGFARAGVLGDIVDGVQETVVVVNQFVYTIYESEWQDVLFSDMPVDDFRVWANFNKEGGIKWTF